MPRPTFQLLFLSMGSTRHSCTLEHLNPGGSLFPAKPRTPRGGPAQRVLPLKAPVADSHGTAHGGDEGSAPASCASSYCFLAPQSLFNA